MARDQTIPKERRLQAGRYIMSCGEESVRIYRQGHDWLCDTGSGRHALQSFATKQAASEWAYDWLAEHA